MEVEAKKKPQDLGPAQSEWTKTMDTATAKARHENFETYFPNLELDRLMDPQELFGYEIEAMGEYIFSREENFDADKFYAKFSNKLKMIYVGDADKLYDEVVRVCEESGEPVDDDAFYCYAGDAIDYADISLLYDGEHIHSNAGSNLIVEDWGDAFES